MTPISKRSFVRIAALGKAGSGSAGQARQRIAAHGPARLGPIGWGVAGQATQGVAW